MGRILFFLVLALAVLAGLWWLMAGRPLFLIRVRRGQVEVRGKVPGHRLNDLVEFFASLRLPYGAKVRGLRDGHRFRVRCSGIPAGQQQKIRNYLYLSN